MRVYTHACMLHTHTADTYTQTLNIPLQEQHKGAILPRLMEVWRYITCTEHIFGRIIIGIEHTFEGITECKILPRFTNAWDFTLHT